MLGQENQKKPLCQLCQKAVDVGPVLCDACLDRVVDAFFVVPEGCRAGAALAVKRTEFLTKPRVAREKFALGLIAMGASSTCPDTAR